MKTYETKGLARFGKERAPKVGACPFGKHVYDASGKCACGQIKPKRKQ